MNDKFSIRSSIAVEVPFTRRIWRRKVNRRAPDNEWAGKDFPTAQIEKSIANDASSTQMLVWIAYDKASPACMFIQWSYDFLSFFH